MGNKDEKHRSSKDSHSKHKKHKKSHKKSHKKDKDRKKRRDYSSDSDTSSPSSGGDARPRLDVKTQLAMGRAAARALREILAYNYDLRTEIRQLSRHLDGGHALDISGLADVFLRDRLCILFDNLLQVKKTAAGHYLRIEKASTVTSFVAPILEESPASLAPYKVVQTIGGGQAAPAPAAAAKPDEKGKNEPQDAINTQDNEQNKNLPESSHIPPSDPPIEAAVEPPTHHDNVEINKNNENEALPSEPPAGPRRVLGPAMPPPEILKAAAAIPVNIDINSDKHSNGGGGFTAPAPATAANNEDEDDEDNDFIVGPPPPEYLLETDLASMDDRSAEVARVMEVLRQHETDKETAAMLTTSGAAPEPVPADAYLILGVDFTAPVGEIKKRYWRLSLLIHPDKCNHPNAAVAFQAVAAAAQTLQDSTGRAVVDKRREDAELRRFTEEYAAQEEKERQWRIARGQATAEDLAKSNKLATGGSGGGGGGRDAWMTDLPPEKASVSALPPQGHQTAFSARGPYVRGDTSGWTMTPQQRAAAEAEGAGSRLGGAATGPALLMASVSDGGADERTAAAVAAYNSVARGKSLLEQHLEKQEQKKKKKKKTSTKESSDPTGKKRKKSDTGGGAGGEDDDDWDREAHPWRPFDREKDLEIKSSGSKDPKEMLKNMKGLGSRFAGSGGR